MVCFPRVARKRASKNNGECHQKEQHRNSGPRLHIIWFDAIYSKGWWPTFWSLIKCQWQLSSIMNGPIVPFPFISLSWMYIFTWKLDIIFMNIYLHTYIIMVKLPIFLYVSIIDTILMFIKIRSLAFNISHYALPVTICILCV